MSARHYVLWGAVATIFIALVGYTSPSRQYLFYTISLSLTFILFLFKRELRREISKRPLFLMLGCFALTPGFLSLDIQLSLANTFPLLMFVFAVYLGGVVCTLRQWQTFLILYISGSVAASLVSVWEFWGYFGRVNGIFEDLNFSALFALGGLISLVSLARFKSIRVGLLAFLAFLIALGLATSFSRSVLGLFIVSFSVLVGLYWRSEFRKKVIWILAGSILSLVIVNFVGFLSRGSIQFGQTSFSSLGVRTPIYAAVLQMILDCNYLQMLFGVGWGGFKALYPSYRFEYVSSGDLAHCDYLQYLLEAGIVGLVAILSLIVRFFWGVFIDLRLNAKNFILLGGAPEVLMCFIFLVHASVNFVLTVASSMFVLGFLCAKVSRDVGVFKSFGKGALLYKWGFPAFSAVLFTYLAAVYLNHISWFYYKGSASDENKVKVANIMLLLYPNNYNALGALASKLFEGAAVSGEPARSKALALSISLKESQNQLAPTRPDVYFTLGEIKRYQNQVMGDVEAFDQYVRYMTQALISNPAYTPAYLRLFELSVGSEKERLLRELYSEKICQMIFGSGDDNRAIIELLANNMDTYSGENLGRLKQLIELYNQNDIEGWRSTYHTGLDSFGCYRYNKLKLWEIGSGGKVGDKDFLLSATKLRWGS